MTSFHLLALSPSVLASSDAAEGAWGVGVVLFVLLAGVISLGVFAVQLSSRMRKLEDAIAALRVQSPVLNTPVVAPTPVAASRPVESVASAPSPVVAEIPADVIAVIAAAVKLSVGGAYRISAIVPVASHDWAQEGRRSIFASHQIR